MSDDTNDILRGLDRGLERLIDRLYPGCHIDTKTQTARPTYKGGKDLGSFMIHLASRGKARRGNWRRWSQNIGGGPLSLIAYAETGSEKVTKETFDFARDFLGISTRRREYTEEEKTVYAKRKADEEAKRKARQEEAEREDRMDRDKRVAKAMEISKQTTWDISGTPAEAYLLGRGIEVESWTNELGHNPSLPYWPLAEFEERDGKSYLKTPPPKYHTLICRVRDRSGMFCGIWRIYIEEINGQWVKASVPEEPGAKLGLGDTGGGAVWITGYDGDVVEAATGEGVETMFGVSCLLRHGLACLACLSTSGLIGFEAPENLETVWNFPDGDKWKLDREKNRLVPPPGITASQQHKRNFEASRDGRICHIQAEPPPGKDYLDLWNLQKRAVG